MSNTIHSRLTALADAPYKAFQSKLMPTVDPDTVLGVRTPPLRRLAKELRHTPDAETFLTSLPHTYYEENNLHGFLIEYINDYDTCIAALDAFLPYVNNWATCDSTAPKILISRPAELADKAFVWMASDRIYTVRYGIGVLMRWFLDDRFESRFPDAVAAVRSEEYYIRMMQAWYFATALAKQYDIVLPYLTERRLDPWIHNKTIQKAVESFRITDTQKAYLRTLRLPSSKKQ